jgi:hypothetical protein
MKGLLKKTETGNWVVLYTKHHPTMIVKEWNSSFPLHPDCVKFYYLTDNDNRTNVEFEIVTMWEKNTDRNVPTKDDFTSYAKLIKQNELMDDVDKLSWEYSPVKKLEHEFIRAAFKAGYNKAKETLYSEEEVLNALHSVELKYNKDFTKIYEGMKEWFEQYKKGSNNE